MQDLRMRTIENCFLDGFSPPGYSGGRGDAIKEAARRLRVSQESLLAAWEAERDKFIQGEPNSYPAESLFTPPTSGCFLPGAEIATKNRGFILFEQLTLNDLVATLNPKTFELEWQRPYKIVNEDYEGEVISLPWGRHILGPVTPDHRFLIRDKARPPELRTASDMNEFFIPEKFKIPFARLADSPIEWSSLFQKPIVEKYKGKIHCCSTHNELIFVSVNGLNFWSGNSDPVETPPDRVAPLLRKRPMSLDEIATKLGVSRGQALDELEKASASGLNVHHAGERWSIETTPPPGKVPPGALEYKSRPDNKFVFGCISDNHYASKYERDDVAQDLYNRFAKAGVDRVFNAGNWIDGEATFNKFDLKVHGLEPQLRHLIKHYPHRDGIVTYAIAGEDHEGWLGRREAIDVGRFTERLMREAGRNDWRHIGFMEAYVPLINANTGAASQLLVMHPGGGSAYATSYRPQKIVESFEGGEKPAVLLIGHYHKLSVNLVRNVWALQIGCTQDQTVFMRKKNIDAHIGGMIVELEQDPATGAILGCKAEMIRYFNQGYYQGRWSPSEEVILPKRKANAA